MRRVQVLFEGDAGQVSIVKIFDKIWSALDRAITAMMALGAAIIIIDMLAVSVDVILRYSIGFTYTGLFELTEYSLLWITFLATAWLLKINGHIRLDLILDRLNPRRKLITNIVTSVNCEIMMGFLITVPTFSKSKSRNSDQGVIKINASAEPAASRALLANSNLAGRL